MRQIYAVLAILLPLMILVGVSVRSISALQTHPNDGDPIPPHPQVNPNGDPMPPEPHANPISPLDGDPGPPTPH